MPFTATNLPGHADDASEAIGWFDAHTGLDWLASSAQEHTHANAEAYCKALADLGHSDWRLPTIRELLALVDYDQRNPAVDRAIAHLVKAEWHWSSSPVPGNPDCARGVSFGYGYSDYDHRSGAFHVLACRGGVAPAGVSPGQ